MQSDIVERLRAVLHNDRSVELMNREAADEIDRLRAELSKKVGELAAAWMVKDDLLAELAKVRQQLDEARRDACAFEAINRWNEAHPKGIMSPCAVARIAGEIAAKRGWDCFAQQEGGGA